MNKKFYSLYLLLPQLLIYTIFFMLPVLIGLGASFTDWNDFNRNGLSFVGLTHIKYALFDDPNTRLAFRNIFIFGFIVMVIQNAIGLGLALLMNLNIKTSSYVRSVFFAPVVLSSVIIAYTFSAILYPAGPLDQLLTSLGMKGLIQGWLTDKNLNIFVIGLVHSWWYMGYSATIFLVGLKSIPGELMEAARIDGSNGFYNFKNITLPLIGPAVTVNMVGSLIGSLKVFDLPYLMASAGVGCPVVNSMIIFYNSKGLKAYGTALNLILVAAICLIAMPLLAIFRKREVEM